MPHKREWHTFEVQNVDPNDPRDLISVYSEALNNLGKAVINKRIRDVRFAYWKSWVDLFIPILALIVAALALFKDIIVEGMKKP